MIEDGMARRRIPHAFGGAIALAYYATPRATIDIDVNVFVDVGAADDVLGVIEGLGGEPISPEERVRLDRDEQARVHWEATPIDLFFSYDAFHESCLERRREFPFSEGQSIHVLSAEDLVIFKVIFDREKDWRDIAEVLFAMSGEFDSDYVEGWAGRILGPGDAREARLHEALGLGIDPG